MIPHRAPRPLAGLLLVALALGCGDRADRVEPAPAPEAPAGWFEEVSAEVGIDFQHRNGASGRKYLVETNGSGVAWLDADGDGRLDLYLVQGAPLPGWTGDRELHNQLWMQREGRFVDETEAAGVGDRQHGMAAAAPDVDGDGRPELFVTNWGTLVLYHNLGEGRFADRTREMGLQVEASYHSSCLFTDLDRDGDVDLYVVRYLDWSLENDPPCGQPERGEEYRSYCHPDMFRGLHDLVFRNDDGTGFVDRSEAAGLVGVEGKGLGVAGADVDADGDVDLFVANDSNENQLWRNGGDWTFEDVAPVWGVAFNGNGATEACMGCEFADMDADGDFDLFTANLSGETNTLWLWQGDSFRDRSFASGLAAASEPHVGFGLRIADFDRDGRPDVAVANGHVLDNAALFDRSQTYLQPSQLYRGVAPGRFEPVPAATLGQGFAGPRVGRALATADYDDDGDLDLLITSNGGRCALLRNRSGEGRVWLGVQLQGRRSPRDGSDSVVEVQQGERRQVQRVPVGGSYLSDHDRRLIFGLDAATEPAVVVVRWASGEVQRVEGLSPGRYHRIVEEGD